MDNSEVIALLIDDSDRIADVVFNGLGVELSKGAHAGDACVTGSADKFTLLLQEAREAGIATNWEIPLRTKPIPMLSRLSGTRLGEHVFVIGNAGDSDAYDLYDELMRINNEQATQLRAAVKKIARTSQTPPVSDRELYEEMTRLNNELSALQRSLTKKNRELERLDQRKNQILGMVAHDLRNPLGSIVGFAQLLFALAGDRLDERCRGMIENIQAASEFMLTLVEDLLDFSVIESGQIRLDRERVNLRAILHTEVERSQPFAARKDISIVLTAEPVAFKIDARKIQQVVANLISNAIKYSDEHKTVQVVGRRDGSHVHVEVVDQGQGIPVHEQQKLFQPFATTSVRGTAGEKSTGLGLAIARKVVEAHGGDIGFESTVGEGSRFWFRLPV